MFVACSNELLGRVVSSEKLEMHNIAAYSLPFDVHAKLLCFFIVFKVFFKTQAL